MKLVYALSAITLASFAAQIPAAAQAHSPQEVTTAWYAGASLGQSSQKLRMENISTPLSGNQSTSDTGYKLLGGYQFDRNWAAEFQYFNLGKYKYSSTNGTTGTAVIKTNGFSISAVGSLPVSAKFSLLGKLGLAQQTFSASAASSTTTQSRQISGTTLLLGLGGEYEISKNLRLRAEYEYFGLPTLISSGSQKVKLSNNLISVGFRYSF